MSWIASALTGNGFVGSPCAISPPVSESGPCEVFASLGARKLSSFGPIRQHFALKRHLLRTSLYRKQLAARFDAWRLFTVLTQNSSTVF